MKLNMKSSSGYSNRVLETFCVLVSLLLSIDSAKGQTPEEKEIDEIELSPMDRVPGCESEEGRAHNPCKRYRLRFHGADPTMFYFLSKLSEDYEDYQNSINVWLVNADDLDEIVNITVAKKAGSRKKWKSEVDLLDFRVIEKWEYRPVDPKPVYRLRWKIGDELYFSEPFEIWESN